MDSLQAKRANAISFQLRLRDKTQPVKKNDKPDIPVGFVAFMPLRRDFSRFAERQGLVIEELRPYYITSYFSVLFPVYLLWRAWIVACRALARENAAETFVLIARKPGNPASGTQRSKRRNGRQQIRANSDRRP